MRTRLERDIERGAARLLTGAGERLRLRMGPAAGGGPAAADNDTVLDDNRADRRVRPCLSEAAPSKRQRKLHIAAVGSLYGAGLLRETVLQKTEDHLRSGTGGRKSSSPDNSPRTASKSFASRKLR